MARKAARLLVCGLGPEPTRTATLETLLSLRRAAPVYSCGLSRDSLRFLAGLGVRARPFAGALKLAAGKTAALVCEGAPAFYGPAAASAQRLARSRGADVEILNAVGPAGSSAVAAGRILGIDVLRLEAVAEASVEAPGLLRRHGASARALWLGRGRGPEDVTIGGWARTAAGPGVLLLEKA